MGDTMEYASMKMLVLESKIAAKWERRRAALEKAEAAEWAAFWKLHLTPTDLRTEDKKTLDATPNR